MSITVKQVEDWTYACAGCGKMIGVGAYAIQSEYHQNDVYCETCKNEVQRRLKRLGG